MFALQTDRGRSCQVDTFVHAKDPDPQPLETLCWWMAPEMVVKMSLTITPMAFGLGALLGVLLNRFGRLQI
jgi:hypothetical protein